MKDIFRAYLQKERWFLYEVALHSRSYVSVQAKGFRWCLGELTLTASGGRGCLAYALVIHDCGTDYSQIQWLRAANSHLHLVCVWLHLAACGMSVPSPGDGTCTLWSANTNSLPRNCQRALSHNFWESGICRSSWVPWFWVPWSSRGSSRADPLPGARGVSTAFTWSSCALARGFPCPLGPPQGSSQPGPSFHQSERARKGMYWGNQSCNPFSKMTSWSLLYFIH